MIYDELEYLFKRWTDRIHSTIPNKDNLREGEKSNIEGQIQILDDINKLLDKYRIIPIAKGMLAIGNGEPCPICGEMQTPNDANTTFKHVEEKHPKEYHKILFGDY